MRAAMFDLDGTLVDSSKDLAISANAVRQAMGLDPLAVDQVSAMVGDGLGVLLERLLPGDADFTQARSIFSAHYDQQCTQHTDFFPGMVPVLQACAQRGISLAVVSNKPQRWCQAIVDHLGSKHDLPAAMWQAVIGGDGVKKPAPDPLWEALAQMQVSADQAVMVGDHANDICAGQAAGCRTVYVSWGFAALPPAVVPDWCCSDSQQLAEALLGT